MFLIKQRHQLIRVRVQTMGVCKKIITASGCMAVPVHAAVQGASPHKVKSTEMRHALAHSRAGGRGKGHAGERTRKAHTP